MSPKRREALYAAIQEAVADARIHLKADPETDVVLFQLTWEIWQRQKKVLELDNGIKTK
jgi:hypothetical protein